MAARKVVIIEDDELIASSVATRLRSEGFHVRVAVDGLAGVQMCESERPDIVVLDLMLPGIDGLEVCRRLQRHHPLPVLMLTARDDEADMLIGLAVGADDYMTKPFSPRELVARVRTILRRTEHTGTTVIAVGKLEIDTARRVVMKGGSAHHLTTTEFDLIAALAARRGAVLTREELLREVWGYADGSSERTVDSHVRSLRSKLGPDAVRTVHGSGYAIGEASATGEST